MKKIMFNDRYGLTQAAIEGRKTNTRRPINPMPKDCAAVHKGCWGADWSDKPMTLVIDRDTGGIYCKYCGNGVRLYDGGYHYKTKYKVGEVVAVAQSYEQVYLQGHMSGDDAIIKGLKYNPGMCNKMYVRANLMPHRIRITGVRCERLQDISDDCCLKEGIRYVPEIDKFYFEDVRKSEGFYFYTPRDAFAALIDKVSGRGTWGLNPWVVVYEFELVK